MWHIITKTVLMIKSLFKAQFTLWILVQIPFMMAHCVLLLPPMTITTVHVLFCFFLLLLFLMSTQHINLEQTADLLEVLKSWSIIKSKFHLAVHTDLSSTQLYPSGDGKYQNLLVTYVDWPPKQTFSFGFNYDSLGNWVQ